MSALNDQILDTEEQVLETVESFQDPLVKLVGRVATQLEPRLPDLDFGLVPAGTPTARELIDAQFGFARKVLDSQRKFVNALFDASSPVAVKVVGEVASIEKAPTKRASRAAA